jgi:cytochrome c oxidase subunit 2
VRAFAEAGHTTFRGYLQAVRMARAAELLRDRPLRGERGRQPPTRPVREGLSPPPRAVTVELCRQRRDVDFRAVRGRPLVRMIVISVVAAAIGTAIVLIMDWFPEDASSAAGPIDKLYDVLLIFSVPIFVLVMAVAIYSVIVFRARPGDMGDGAPIHGNTRLEIFWVTIPFLIVAGLAVYGWIVLDDIEAKQPNETVVKVVGQQFTWHFEYPQEKIESSELVLAKDRPVHFEITSEDVIHSFWVPEFRLKYDAVPGLTTDLHTTPNKVGEWNVVCAELCGLGHSTMRQEVRVIEEAEWDSWVEQQKKSPDRIGRDSQ